MDLMKKGKKECKLILIIFILTTVFLEVVEFIAPNDHLPFIDQRLQDRFYAMIVITTILVGYVIYRLIKKKVAGRAGLKDVSMEE